VNPTHGLRQLLVSAGISETSAAGMQLLEFLELLRKWNRQMNLTGSTDWATLGPLFDEAIWAAGRYPGGAIRHLDLGSGAGFPCVPICILRPEMALDLVEARLKRSVFLETVSSDLKLARVRIHAERITAFLERGSSRTWDIVSWKAIRIEGRDLRLLVECQPRELWVFHGRTFPGDEARILETYHLAARDPVPDREGSFLSRYST